MHLEEIARLFDGEAKHEMLTACARYGEIAGDYRQLHLDFSPWENLWLLEDRSVAPVHLKGIATKERNIVCPLDRTIWVIWAVCFYLA
ncbi:MAG: hypothetical protein V1800_11280 [Candidatus Latescibacterota bacterium]